MTFPCTNHTWLLNVIKWWPNFFGYQWDVWIVSDQKNLVTIPQVWKQPKKFGCIVGNLKILIANWSIVYLVTKIGQLLATKFISVIFNYQWYSGPMVTEPIFNCHLATKSMMLVSYWMVTKKFQSWTKLGYWTKPAAISCIQWQPQAIKTSLGLVLGLWDVWVHYKTHNFLISCNFFLTYELFALSNQCIHLEESESPLEGF